MPHVLRGVFRDVIHFSGKRGTQHMAEEADGKPGGVRLQQGIQKAVRVDQIPQDHQHSLLRMVGTVVDLRNKCLKGKISLEEYRA
jgi:hypothetical protein